VNGLYDPSYEHDACGVAFVARIGAPGSHEVISRALYALEQLEHRGAEGADPDTGDGSGILIQIPDLFLREEAGLALPASGGYGVGMCFLPQDAEGRAAAVQLMDRTIEAEGLRLLGWREVPIDDSACGAGARRTAPHIAQVFAGATEDGLADRDELERQLYVIRRVVEREHLEGLSIASLSSRTLV
jgi:glutamate synthase (NADPH) large chain